MNLKFLIAFIFLSVKVVWAQDGVIDSLQTNLKTTTNDTVKCKVLFQLTELLPEAEWQAANEQLIELSKQNLLKTKNNELKNFYNSKYASAIATKAYEQTDKGNYSDAVLSLYLESLELFEKLEDFENSARLNNNIGLHFYLRSDYKQALNYYQKALAITKRTNNNEGTISLLNNIASIYHDTKDFKQALNYYRECLTISSLAKDEKNVVQVYNNIGALYNAQHKLDSAIFYLQKSIIVSTSTGDYKNLGTALNNLGAFYYDEKNNEKALDYFNKSLEINVKNGFRNNEAISYIRIAKVWLDLKETTKAETYAKKTLVIGKQINSLDLINRAAFVLVEVHKQNKNYKEALEMTDLYNSTNDSINNKQIEKALIQNKYKYEYENKAIADSLKTLKDKAVLSLQIEKDKNQKLFLYILVGLIIAFALFLFNRFRISTKQKQQIEQANKKLELANNDLGRQHILNQKIFSVISHDFRGPILSLKLLLDGFKKKSDDTAMKEYVDNVSHEVTNANEILNNLLNWARTEISIRDFETTHTTIASIYTATIAEFEQKLQAKNLRLDAAISKEDSIELPPDILRIALRNLLSNAIKFSFENAVIKVVYDAKISLLSVIDFGKGMSEPTKNKLFIKEVDTELGTNNEEGFGMGLYILNELLHKYNYKITVESELNKGACFTIQKN